VYRIGDGKTSFRIAYETELIHNCLVAVRQFMDHKSHQEAIKIFII
jgi:hypothetical protein